MTSDKNIIPKFFLAKVRQTKVLGTVSRFKVEDKILDPASANPCFPNITSFDDHGGGLLTNVRVVLIFWGAQWARNPIPSVNNVTAAVNGILSSPYMVKLNQYRCIMKGQLRSIFVNAATDPNNPFSDDHVSNMVWDQIRLGTVPNPFNESNLLYCVIMPQGYTSSDYPNLIGRHYHFNVLGGPRVYLTWIENDGTLISNNSISRIFSHELVEACTNPDLDSGIMVDGDQEIGDVCSTCVQILNFGSLQASVQAYWSYADSRCILPSAPIVDWSGLCGWRRISPNQTTSRFYSNVSCVARSPNNLDLFVVGNDGGIYTTWWYNGIDWPGLNGWRQISPPNTASPGGYVSSVARSPNNLDLFVVGNYYIDDTNYGALYTTWWYNGIDWPGYLTQLSSNDIAVPGSVISSVSRNPNQLDVFIAGAYNAIYTTWWTLGSDWFGIDTWGRRISPNNTTTIDVNTVSSVSRNPNQIDLFVAASDGAIYTSWWPYTYT